MNDEKVRDFVRWEGTDALAVAEQLRARVLLGQAKGFTLGVVTCIVWQDPERPGNSYEIACSRLPVEVVAWAGELIHEKAHE